MNISAVQVLQYIRFKLSARFLSSFGSLFSFIKTQFLQYSTHSIAQSVGQNEYEVRLVRCYLVMAFMLKHAFS